MAELSESELLARIFPRLHGGDSTALLLGPGDDAAIVAAPDGRAVVSIDTQVVDQDFRLEWNNGYRTTGYDVGWKAAAQNLSDINAMGARATSLVVSLTMPPETRVAWVEDFADGLSAAIRELGAPDCAVAGGDLGRGRELAVSVAILGTLDGRSAVLRSGARPGDTLALAGKPALGAMNRLKASSSLTDGAKWRLAAAYQLAGQPDVAKQLMGVDPIRVLTDRELGGTYGSTLRDQAMALEALVLIEPGSKRADEVARKISERLTDKRWLSTQETAFALVAMARYAGAGTGDPLSLTWRLGADPAQDVRSDKPMLSIPLPVIDGTPELKVKSSTGAPLYARLVTRGLPRLGEEEAAASGITVTVEYVQTEPYQQLGVVDLDQGVDFKAIVKVKNNRGKKLEELALTQVVPSGWEIHGTAPGPGDGYEYRDVRDDRVLTYFDLDKGAERTFTVGLNASYKGRYYLPPIIVEAMYDAEINGRTKGEWVQVAEPGPRG